MTTLTEHMTIERPHAPLTLRRLADAASGARGGSDLLGGIRAAGAARARELGMPERTHERWRTSDPRVFLDLPCRIAPRAGSGAAPGRDDGALSEVEAAARVAFFDGLPAPEASGPAAVPDGVEISFLEDLAGEEADRVRELIARDIAEARDALEALGCGLAGCGVAIRVREGVRLGLPILLTFRSGAGGAEPLLVAPRVVVFAEAGSELVLIEDHAGEPGAEGLTLGATTLEVAEGASVSHVQIDRTAESWRSFTLLRSRQARESRVRSRRFLLGGASVRNNVVATLGGEGADAELAGLFLPRDRQHHDNEMRVEHMAPGCTSRQYYRGMPSDRGRGVFTGRIYVHSEAQQTDAIQSSDNLLLSDRAEVNTRPQLEIYADDVRCTHGATTGRLDEDAMFYLRSRGLSERASRLMLLHAFAGEIIDRVENESLRGRLRLMAGERLDAAVAGYDPRACAAPGGSR